MTKKNISGWNAVTLGSGKKEGLKEGIRKGEKGKTCNLIQKKLEKGKTLSQIADELEDTEENVAHLIEQFHLRIN